MKRYLLIAIAAIFILGTPGLALALGNAAPGTSPEAKAAIIDQLYYLDPNQAFVEEATEILEAHGLEVDVWQDKEVTVDLYRELPKYGYSLIIFRAHAGILFYQEGPAVKSTETTYLFTGETYTTTKYVREQLRGCVQSAQVIKGYPMVFAISPSFVTDSMEGRFDNTAIIMAGCSCTRLTDMSAAFVDKGASTYLGWDDNVGLDYINDAVLNLIENLVSEDTTVSQAVAETTNEVGPDPYYHACLKYYPPESDSLTIGELTK